MLASSIRSALFYSGRVGLNQKLDFDVGEPCSCFNCVVREHGIPRNEGDVECQHGTLNRNGNTIFFAGEGWSNPDCEWDGTCPACHDKNNWTPEGMGECCCACGARWGT